MLFNSKIFIAFILITLGLYYFLPDRFKIYFLLLMSYVFYGFWDPWLCSLIALSTVVDFYCGRQIVLGKPKYKKRWLTLSLSSNLGMLGFFKYFDFFVYEFCLAAQWFGFSPDANDYMLSLLLPVGISFYTFQTMAYSIDLYRGDIKKPETSLARFALYVSIDRETLRIRIRGIKKEARPVTSKEESIIRNICGDLAEPFGYLGYKKTQLSE